MTKEKKQNLEPQKEQNQEPKKEEIDYKELLQRTQANFENYRKQQEKRIEEIRNFSAKDMVLQILPIIDNFELALKNTNCEKNEFIQGVELIYSQLYEILERNDVKLIVTKHKAFDPYYHEALMKIDSALPENTILEELQKGFTLHDKVIRHSKVKISSGKKSVDTQNKEKKSND